MKDGTPSLMARGTGRPWAAAGRRLKAGLVAGVVAGYVATGASVWAAVRTPPPLPVADPGAGAGVTNELREIRGPVDLPDPWRWVERGGVAALVVALAVLGFWLWWRRRRQEVALEAPDPAVIAWDKIEAAAVLRPEAKPYVHAVSEAVRGYLEARFGLQAPDRTTEEFLAELSAKPVLDARHQEALAGFLGQCDLIKFAPHRPDPADLDDLRDLAQRLVRETAPATARDAGVPAGSGKEAAA